MSSSLTFENYSARFPSEVPLKAVQSFIATAAINAFFGTPVNAVLGGVIAATATVVEAVTRPIIQAVFPEQPQIARVISLVIPGLLVVGAFASLSPWIGVTYKATSFVLPIFALIGLNEKFLSGENVGMVQVL